MRSACNSPPVISLLGTTALLFEAPGTLDLARQQRIWAMAQGLQAWPEVREVVPGMNNLMLTFKQVPPTLTALQMLKSKVLAAWEELPPLPLQGRVIELPESTCRLAAG